VARTLIVVPTTGRRLHWLCFCLSSLVTQSPRPDLVIVAPQKLPDVFSEVFECQCLVFERPGLSAAINYGWSTLGNNYDYLGWLGDDDVLAPDAIQYAERALDERPSAVAVYGQKRTILASGANFSLYRPGRLAGLWLRYGADHIPQPGALFRRSAVLRVGLLDEGLRISMDYDLFLRLSGLGKLVYLPRELAAQRIHAGTITSGKLGDTSEDEIVRQRSLSNRSRSTYKLVRFFTVKADKVYGGLLRRMPTGKTPQVAGVPYITASRALFEDGGQKSADLYWRSDLT
jgi:GT2 family glycosyltransferase